MQFTKMAALAALLTVSAAGSLAAQAQTTDRSGAITLQFQIAKYVEIVSHEPSTHDLTSDSPDGVTPGAGLIDTPDGTVTREVRANTMYRLSVVGADELGVEFLAGYGAPGTGIRLKLQCKSSATEHPASPSDYQNWFCLNSGPMVPTSSSWVTLRAYTEDPSATANMQAGLYQATVYLQIEAI